MTTKTLALGCSILLIACQSTPPYDTTRTVFNSNGQSTESVVESGGTVISELRRQFETQTVTGEGSFVNTNEGLARRAATQLAVTEMAGKVETQVKGNTRIYNNQDIRDVVESQVSAIVQNYQIDYAQYEKETNTYFIKVSITGQKIVEEFERRLRN